jgi:hypothetical protein
MSKSSTQQKISCLTQAMPSFQASYKKYLASMRQGTRPKKQSKNN